MTCCWRRACIRPPGLGIDNVADLRAELEKIRARGYAIVDQELEIGLRSVAVPVFNADGSIAAAMNVSMSVRQQAPVSAEEAAQRCFPRSSEPPARCRKRSREPLKVYLPMRVPRDCRT